MPAYAPAERSAVGAAGVTLGEGVDVDVAV